MQSGDVECIGRSDDQVKIRGFRIELGDINSHLSQHPLIRDSVTLVRRDKDEEPTLVSYIVPELKRWPQWLALRGIKDSADTEDMVGMLKRFRPLQNEVRTHLKRRLPSYAVPTFFIPMIKLPLNPNGKIDKAALPFPDIVQITAAISDDNQQNLWTSLTKTERMVATVWGELIPGVNARVIKVSDSFFDLGGHSILAQQMLLTIRRNLGYAQIPVTALFVDPSLQGFSNELDRIQEPESPKLGPKPILDDYAADAERLKQSLAATYPTRDAFKKTDPLTVFLTGASGFLGTFLLRDLLERTSPPITVIAHVRAKSSDAALLRLKNSCAAYGVWHPSWASRLICVTGNLGEDNLSIDSESYKHILENVDVVIHNGAQVHWVYPYSILKLPNVKGTIDALKLCASGKAKKFVFVSSTSVLDNDHYVELSEKSLETGGTGVLESDDLQGSKRGLSTGYGQSKWVGEYLVRLAGTLGLSGAIIRPGYILGDSRSGGMSSPLPVMLDYSHYQVTNTDDFLIRMLKGKASESYFQICFIHSH